MFDFIAAWRRRRTAISAGTRAAIEGWQAAANEHHTALRQPIGHTRRAHHLHKLHIATAHLADLVRGTEPDVASGLDQTSAAYLVLSDVELAIAGPLQREPFRPDVEHAAGHLLNLVLTAGQVTPLLRAGLAEALLPVLGEQAAIAISNLPLGPDGDDDAY